MFKLLKKINNVSRYNCFQGQLIASFKNRDYSGVIKKYDLPSCQVLLEKKVDACVLFFLLREQSFFSQDINNEGWLFNESLEVILKIPSPLKIGDNYLITDYIAVFQGKIKNREFGVYSLINNDVLWMDRQQKALESFGEMLFGQSNFEIHRTDPKTGEILWRQNLKTEFTNLNDINGRITLLGIFRDVLIIGVNKIDKLVALSLETGSLRWERTSFPSLDCLDKEKGVIHSISSSYLKSNVTSGEEIDSFIDRHYFEGVGIFSQRDNYAIDGDYIITTDHEKGVIGAFNTVTHKFDWVHNEEGVNFPSPSPIKYQAPYLFVHDNEGTLYVFEKNIV